MIPVLQTILHDPENGLHGNCFSAVLASLLHMDIDTIPVFTTTDWVREVNKWLRPHGLAYLLVDPSITDVLKEQGVIGLWHEIAGNTVRSNDVIHACVALDCATNYDPHPSNDGLTNTVNVGIFIALEPWRAILSATEVKNGT